MRLKTLIKGCKKQNKDAQEELYRKYSSQLFGICLKYSRNKQEAEDNLQEALITIFNKIEQFKNKGSFEGWMKRITVNTVLQTYRKIELYEIVDEEKIQAPDLTAPQETFQLGFLLKTIQNLPDRYRLAFNLYVLDGLTHREIAGILNISEGTSKSNLSRARKILQKELKQKRQPELISSAL
jgi:RNA polymerase sigma-70 factor (ECF subfamily)